MRNEMTSHTADEVSEASARRYATRERAPSVRNVSRAVQIDLLGALKRMTEERPAAVQIGGYARAYQGLTRGGT